MLHISSVGCWSSVFDKLIDCLVNKNTSCVLCFDFMEGVALTQEVGETIRYASFTSQPSQPSQNSQSDTVTIPIEEEANPAAAAPSTVPSTTPSTVPSTTPSTVPSTTPPTLSLSSLVPYPTTYAPTLTLSLDNCESVFSHALIPRSFIQYHLRFLYDTPMQDPKAPAYSFSSERDFAAPAPLQTPPPSAQRSVPKMTLVQADHVRQMK